VRTTKATSALIYATVVAGDSYNSDLISSQQINSTGSTKFNLLGTQTLMLNVIFANKSSSALMFEIYSIG
jgi:hypothetical protein